MSLDAMNRFVKNPVTLDISRSRFKRPFTHKTTFKSGKLIPIFCDEVLPGDTFEIKWSSVIRMLTPAVPVMDNAFLDMYFFFVPNRLCTYGTNVWQQVMGENTSSYWASSSETTLSSSSNTFSLYNRSITSQSVANYLGLPIGSSFGIDYNNLPISLLPFNAYIKIWNEWFRDECTQAPKSVLYAGSSDLSNYLTDCLEVNRLHDYFTSSLPSPQKGASVLLPLGTLAPVKTGINDVVSGSQAPMKFRFANNGTVIPSTDENAAIGVNDSSQGALIDNITFAQGASGNSTIYPSNLYADLQNATAASVNEMRQAFAIQRLLEKDARGGTRYREILKAHFGVTVPDLTVQVPEYLGGKRIPLNITQVLATAEGTNVPLGKTGAFSNTSASDFACIKSFSEFGFVFGVCCVRTEQSYSQGIPKLFTRNRRYDWYLPALANIGEQPVMTRELFVRNNSSTSFLTSTVFGYQEAWADYRFKPNMVTGNLAPNANDTTLTSWTYTNKFTAAPVLNSAFMVQPSSQIGDTLVVTNTEQQFVADFYFDLTCTRPMPLYSIPGLIDHH